MFKTLKKLSIFLDGNISWMYNFIPTLTQFGSLLSSTTEFKGKERVGNKIQL